MCVCLSVRRIWITADSLWLSFTVKLFESPVKVLVFIRRYVWLLNQFISAGLEPFPGNSCIASQFSSNRKKNHKIITSFGIPDLRSLGSNKTSFIIFFQFNIRAKLSIIWCDKSHIIISYDKFLWNIQAYWILFFLFFFRERCVLLWFFLLSWACWLWLKPNVVVARGVDATQVASFSNN